MARKFLAAAAIVACTGPLAAEIRFAPVDIPMHAYTGGWEFFVGGGLAAFDCNGDGRPELFAAGGAGKAVLLRNRSDANGIAFQADTPPALALAGVVGAYPLDIDGDGMLDLALLRVGRNRLMRGGPDCAFTPIDDLGFASGDRWSTAFSAIWEGDARLPTLAFGNYVDRTDPTGPFRACDTNYLYRPDGARYGAPMPLTPGFCALSMLFSDWGRKGRADLRVSNDRHYYVTGGEEQMWAMGTVPRLYTAADGWQSHRLWGMGIASRDLDGDGIPEVMMSSMGDQRLQRLDRAAGGPDFQDVPYDMGTTAQRPYEGGDGRPSTGWQVAFGDVNNDGHDDIFIAKGNVEQMPDAAMDDPNNLLIQTPEGRFREVGGQAGVASMARGRGAVLADFDGDGRLDLAVVNRRAPMQVWRNVSTGTGHWIEVALKQDGANINAVGAWIELRAGGRTQSREITVGGGHAGGSALPEHFGLGEADTAQVRVTWPDGATSGWARVSAGQTVMLQRKGDGFLRSPRN